VILGVFSDINELLLVFFLQKIDIKQEKQEKGGLKQYTGRKLTVYALYTTSLRLVNHWFTPCIPQNLPKLPFNLMVSCFEDRYQNFVDLYPVI